MNTGERIFNSEASVGVATRGTADWSWAFRYADPCEGAAGVAPEDQGIGVFTAIANFDNRLDVDGNVVAPDAPIRMWQNWFDAPFDSVINGMSFQFYTGLQDPGFTPGDPDNNGEAQGIVDYDMIMAFTEDDDPASQSTAVAHSPILVTELPGANDSDGSGTIEFAEGFLWTFFLDFTDTPIEIADSDASTTNPEGVDSDAADTVGSGFADCGFVVTFRQPNVAEGDQIFSNNEIIDFSGVSLDPVDGIGNPGGSAPDNTTFQNILPTGTGLFAPSNRLETFAAMDAAITQWPLDTAVTVEEGEGLGGWDAMGLFDAAGTYEAGPGFLFYFGGFHCNPTLADGYVHPYSGFNVQFNIDAVGGGDDFGCNAADVAEPENVLDLADINAFIAGFLAQDDISDIDENGIWDLADINGFIAAFLAGCP
jgi:hypothetical protein